MATGEEPSHFGLGSRVRVVGLGQASHHNGKLGAVIAPLDAQTGRLGVKLEDGTEVRIKSCNVQLQQHPDDAPEAAAEQPRPSRAPSFAKMFKRDKEATKWLESTKNGNAKPLTLADFDEYILRLGRNSPTPADAMRFGMLSMRLDIQGQDSPRVIVRRFIIDTDGTAEAAMHAYFKVSLDILRQMKAVAAATLANPQRLAQFLAELVPIYTRVKESPFDSGNTEVLKPIFMDGKPNCAHCGGGGKESSKLKFCACCRSVRYCSADHQKAHWPEHQKVCKALHTTLE